MSVISKPTDYADWATEDQINPVSGQSNKSEPPSSEVESGWTYLEKPPRQWFNWWQNVVGQWVRYLEFISLYRTVATTVTTDTTLVGTTTKTVVPCNSASTLNITLDNTFALGQPIIITNINATGTVQVKANDASNISTVAPLTTAQFYSLADLPADSTKWTRIGIQEAGSSQSGMMSSGTQNIGGVKTYPGQPCFSAEKTTSTQTGLTSATLVQVVFNLTNFNVGSYYSPSAFTPPAGKYIFTWRVALSSTTAQQFTLAQSYLRKNGTNYSAIGSSMGTTSNLFDNYGSNGSAVVDASGTDFFEVWAGCFTNTGTWQINAGSVGQPITYFNAYKIG